MNKPTDDKGQAANADSTRNSELNGALGAELDASLKEIIGADGAELEIWALSGSGCGFYASISSNYYIESFDAKSPLQALWNVVQKYKTLPSP